MKKLIAVVGVVVTLAALSVSAQAPAPVEVFSERRTVTTNKVASNIRVIYLDDGSVRWEPK